MDVSVFGLGYVGFITGICLAKDGHNVIGVDVNPAKVDLVNKGIAPIIEENVNEYITEVSSAGRFRATSDPDEAISNTDLSFVCVGTPSRDNGDIDIQYIERVSCEIGAVLRGKDSFHVVVVRSTSAPGTTEKSVIPLLEEHSGKKAGTDFGVVFNPEFLREGSSIYDFYNPPKIVLGGTDKKSMDRLSEIYSGIDAPTIETSIKCAETVKYADNIFHGLKITFANEIGRFCKSLDIDSHEVMDIFTRDTKLNISPAYFKPGFAFGGSCLPKDTRAFLYKCKSMDVQVPVISAILDSNQHQIDMAVDLIRKQKSRNVGMLGLSFKPGTDDLRESPLVALIETLIGKGYNVKVHDENVSLAKLIGANREYIYKTIPHIADLLSEDLDDVLDHAEILILGYDHPDYRMLREKLEQFEYVLDLAHVWDDYKELGENYSGICWG